MVVECTGGTGGMVPLLMAGTVAGHDEWDVSQMSAVAVAG